jgi:hypothetical protein
MQSFFSIMTQWCVCGGGGGGQLSKYIKKKKQEAKRRKQKEKKEKIRVLRCFLHGPQSCNAYYRSYPCI